MKKIKDNSWLKLLLTGIILIVIYKSVDNLGGIFSFFGTFLEVLMPCIIGAVIALFMYVPTKKLERVFKKVKCKPIQKGARLISALLVYAIAFCLLAFGIKFIIPVLYKNIEELITKIPGYAADLNKLTAHIDFIPKFDIALLEEILKKYLDPAKINSYISLISGIFNSFISVVVSVIISLYIVLETENIKAYSHKLRSHINIGEKADIYVLYARKVVSLFRSYFAGLFLDSLLIGAISTVIFMLFGIKYPAFLGLVIGIGNLVPIFGPIVAAFLVCFIGMISLGPINALWLFVYQIILAQVDGNIINPKIVGAQVGLKPLWVLISVTVFGGLFGPLGMVLGVPVFASVKLILDDLLDDGKVNASEKETKE